MTEEKMLEPTVEIVIPKEILQEMQGKIQRVIDIDETDLTKIFHMLDLDPKTDLAGADLSGADLKRADLRGADLRETDLREADLTGADLSQANLDDALVKGTLFRMTKGLTPELRGDLIRRGGLFDISYFVYRWITLPLSFLLPEDHREPMLAELQTYMARLSERGYSTWSVNTICFTATMSLVLAGFVIRIDNIWLGKRSVD